MGECTYTMDRMCPGTLIIIDTNEIIRSSLLLHDFFTVAFMDKLTNGCKYVLVVALTIKSLQRGTEMVYRDVHNIGPVLCAKFENMSHNIFINA